ncbi:fatty acid desaturase [Paracraurococcus lichenis]|uniref:Fatty acid desaturase n=1 Tax=Paracraurococcus lichenis TaxID=3064888 RepID=A0ABT9DUE2_9PROT|nr:fatty acid desaturase [Paracraurococcus sp. LOR1-02]MDO9707512.1 fatty acid desaturase [Paracraurococcus sp. LOR1-02]
MEAPSATEMKGLAGRSDTEGWRQLAIHAALLLATGTLVALAPGWWVVPAMLLLGIVQAALFAPFHETSHYTAFASRRANAAIGWLSGLPALYNWHFYQLYHTAHHRFTQDPERDPELATPPPTTLDGYLLRVLSIPYWRFRLTVLAAGLRCDLSAYPYIGEAQAPRVIRSIRAEVAVMAGGALVSAALFGWATPFLFWVLPQLMAQPLLRLYLLAEHTGCSTDRNGLTNTRTVLTSPLIRLLMWNMPYHAEHHLYPFIPFHRLGDAHRVLKERLGYLQPGYARFHRDYIRTLRA